MRLSSVPLGALAPLVGVGPTMAERPNKPVRSMAPCAPDGNIDITARIKK
jgi:hypothetical protein